MLMGIKNLFRLRKALKNPKSAKKLVDKIQNEIRMNDRDYQERDRELKDLLKIIESAQNIINSGHEDNDDQ